MIGTLPHCCSEFYFYHQPSFFSSSPSSCKAKSRLGFNDGHSWSLRQTPIAAGGPHTVPSPLHCPGSLQPPPATTPTPPHPVWWRAALKHPVGQPSPHAAALCRRVNPPTTTTTTLLCALFAQGRSDPSLCCLNLHTKAQCKNRQLCGSITEFSPCALQLYVAARSHVRCTQHCANVAFWAALVSPGVVA